MARGYFGGQKFNIFAVSLAAVSAFLLGFFVNDKFGKDIRLYRTTENLQKREAGNQKSYYHDKAAEDVSSSSIKNYFRYFTSVPHIGGSKESYEQAKYLADQLRKFGFDKVELKKYYALLSVPRSPGNVSLYDENGTVLFHETITEKPLHSSEGDPREVYPFNAYTASGQAEGELVYVNYGTDKDFEEIKRMNISLKGKIVICRYGKNFRGDKVNFAEKAGAKGVILFSDPQEFSSDVNYPDSWFLPDTAVQRGNILKQKGDPLSPGYPSTDGMYRMKPENVKFLHKIPCQPISQRHATALLRYLDGIDPPHDGWHGRLNVTYKITSKAKFKARITVDVPLVDRPIYNVIGTIYGDKEPDRMLLIGNHRDAWVYGGGDPSSGTAALVETSRVIGNIKSAGWRPRRTLVVCSWDAEEYGLMGSKEWVEEYAAILSYRAVAYINIDIAVQGNYTLRVKSSPQLVTPFIDVVKELKVPDSNVSLYEDWASKFPDPQRDHSPKIHTLGAGSDFTPFYSVIGVPALDFRYTYNENAMHLGSYPVYHSIHDNYHWMSTFVDPDFKYNKVVTQVWVKYTLKLLDGVILPFNSTRYCEDLVNYIKSFEAGYSELLRANDVDLKMLTVAATDFVAAASKLQSRIDKIDFNNAIAVRTLNDQLMEVERSFIVPSGLQGRPQFKHILYSPSSVNIYLGRSFPAVIEAIHRVETGKDKDWNNVNIQIALVAHHTQMASKILDEIANR
ncbi:putative N-acetylated-alpha-linked acidic dipeptidase [Rhopilema esculentum]|uniref:putative N-acetylated-alpha-linked acidic dipeptidase n=1 Tax=Rhopilema esculentum TaxID=499914 RepID=UPI0031E339E9|eukprot:gene10915-19749_t